MATSGVQTANGRGLCAPAAASIGLSLRALHVLLPAWLERVPCWWGAPAPDLRPASRDSAPCKSNLQRTASTRAVPVAPAVPAVPVGSAEPVCTCSSLHWAGFFLFPLDLIEISDVPPSSKPLRPFADEPGEPGLKLAFTVQLINRGLASLGLLLIRPRRAASHRALPTPSHLSQPPSSFNRPQCTEACGA